MKALKEISCIIIDDEVSSQKVLQHFISETEYLELKQTCSNSEDAFRFLQLNPDIDLLFLDINMPGQSGLDFYKSLKNPPSVIFTTAYPQYAVDGFEVNAIDYLLKPIAYNRFLVAINKYLNGSKTLGANTEFITINENKTLHRVNFSDILFIEAQGDYVKVQLIDNIIVTHS
ncbi:MAG: response regulator, partial [Bacteroidota bacterium]